MRPQTILISAAICVTGLFLAGVAGVVAWQSWPSSPRHDRAGQERRIRMNFENVMPAPFAGIDVPQEKAQPINAADLHKERGAVIAAKDSTISGPHTHGNLSVFFIHGEDTLKDANFLTLQEALEQNLATVHDKGHTLFIDNRANVPLFIQAGDIVKGGNQDRTIPHDMLVPSQASMTPTPAWCVEQGRSFPRAGESHSSFQVSSEQLPGRHLRLALYKDQQAVWNNIQNTQTNLARNAGGSVQAAKSQTSLQLSLEHPRVQAGIQEYLTALHPALEGKEKVVGYAVVVNGKIQSADVYASAALFQKVWPKLIKANAIDALAQRQPGAEARVPAVDSLQAFLNGAEQGQGTRIETAGRGVVIRQETPQHLLHDTCLPHQERLVLHRSLLAK